MVHAISLTQRTSYHLIHAITIITNDFHRISGSWNYQQSTQRTFHPVTDSWNHQQSTQKTFHLVTDSCNQSNQRQGAEPPSGGCMHANKDKKIYLNPSNYMHSQAINTKGLSGHPIADLCSHNQYAKNLSTSYWFIKSQSVNNKNIFHHFNDSHIHSQTVQRETERERERERQTDRQTDRQRQTDRLAGRQNLTMSWGRTHTGLWFPWKGLSANVSTTKIGIVVLFAELIVRERSTPLWTRRLVRLLQNCLPQSLSVSLPVFLSVSLPVSLSVSLPVSLSVLSFHEHRELLYRPNWSQMWLSGSDTHTLCQHFLRGNYAARPCGRVL